MFEWGSSCGKWHGIHSGLTVYVISWLMGKVKVAPRGVDKYFG
jgi:hypothetical protein